jgi:transposase
MFRHTGVRPTGLTEWASRHVSFQACSARFVIYFGKQMKFITVVSNLDTGEPLWFGQDRKQETLDEFFRTQLSTTQRKRVEAACVDMWRPFTNSITQWAPNCRIVYDKFHVLQHANKAIDEVRRAEFFRKGGRMRGVVKGKRWLLLTRWMNLNSQKRQQLNELFALNRRVMKAYLLKESLERLWTYRYEGAMLRYLQSWIDQLRWQRLKPFQDLAFMLLDHLDGILNYCRTKVPFGVVEAINGNIKTLLRRGRGYKNLGYLLLKAQRMAVTKTEFIVLQKAA